MNDFRKVDFMGNIVENENDVELEVSVNEQTTEEAGGRTFFKVYDNFINIIKDLSGAELQLFMAICSLMSWNNSIVLNKSKMMQLNEALNHKGKNTINNLVSSLCKKGFLTRIEPKTYQINEAYVSRQAEPYIKATKKKREVSRRRNFSKLF